MFTGQLQWGAAGHEEPVTAAWQVLWPLGAHQLTWPHVNFGVLLMLAVSISIQLGNTFAAVLFPTVGPMGTMTLRMVIAALLLAPVARPKIHNHTRSDWISVLELAVCLGGLNICIYYALSHLPIGVAVTVEFLGPLTLAALGSRSWRDGIAILLALTGVATVSGAINADWSQLDLFGLGMGLAAGAFWGLYVNVAQRVGRTWPQVEGLWWAILIIGIGVTPFGISQAGSNLVAPKMLLAGAGVALLSSALPYSLEMYALRRIKQKVYGIIVGLEPVVAALAGLIVLHQHLSGTQIGGIALVIVAGWLVLARDKSEEQTLTVEAGQDDGTEDVAAEDPAPAGAATAATAEADAHAHADHSSASAEPHGNA